MNTTIVGDIPSAFQAACGLLCTVTGYTADLSADLDLLKAANIPTEQVQRIQDAAQALYQQAQALTVAVA